MLGKKKERGRLHRRVLVCPFCNTEDIPFYGECKLVYADDEQPLRRIPMPIGWHYLRPYYNEEDMRKDRHGEYPSRESEVAAKAREMPRAVSQSEDAELADRRQKEENGQT